MKAVPTFLLFCLLFAVSLLLSYLGIAKLKQMQTSKTKATQTNAPVRPPAVAGSFYPAEKEKLAAKIEGYLAQTPKTKKEQFLQILIVPHAGLDYSGPVAAAGFKQLEEEKKRTVILLGASHRAYFEGAAVFPAGSWETPLGKVAVDEELAAKVINQKGGVFADPRPHLQEHSLEVELPFLQKVLKDFQIVPVLLGQPSPETLEALAEKIAAILDQQTLLVVSSDLSHYPPYEIAKKVDKKTIQAIVSGKAKNLQKSLSETEAQHYPGLDTCACGYQAILVALQVAEKLNDIDFEEIKYANSGDITGEKNQVVGYAAIAGWRQGSPFQEEALALARQTLQEHLAGRPFSPLSPKSPQLSQRLGAFVTLYKNGELRGCIGKFEPKRPLWQVIQKMAIAAATEDPRFPKVTAEELPDIKIEISVMTPRKKIASWEKIRLGVDGVVVQYGNQAGTFLPQVATETGWSLEEFLSQLCSQKAGLPPHCYKSPEISLYTFQVQIIKED